MDVAAVTVTSCSDVHTGDHCRQLPDADVVGQYIFMMNYTYLKSCILNVFLPDSNVLFYFWMLQSRNLTIHCCNTFLMSIYIFCPSIKCIQLSMIDYYLLSTAT